MTYTTCKPGSSNSCTPLLIDFAPTRFKRRIAFPHAKTIPPLLSSGLCLQVIALFGAPQSKTISMQCRGLKYSLQLWMRHLHSSRRNIPFPMCGFPFLILRHAEIFTSCAKYSGTILLYQKHLVSSRFIPTLRTHRIPLNDVPVLGPYPIASIDHQHISPTPGNYG